jgi:hypothetical protein
VGRKAASRAQPGGPGLSPRGPMRAACHPSESRPARSAKGGPRPVSSESRGLRAEPYRPASRAPTAASGCVGAGGAIGAARHRARPIVRPQRSRLPCGHGAVPAPRTGSGPRKWSLDREPVPARESGPARQPGPARGSGQACDSGPARQPAIRPANRARQVRGGGAVAAGLLRDCTDKRSNDTRSLIQDQM